MYIFARVKEIGLRQNTNVVNAHSCLSSTYSFSPLVVCSLVPNPHLPSQVFPLITDFIDSQIVWYGAFLTFIIVKGEKKPTTTTTTKHKKNKKKIKNFRLKRLGKPQYIFIIFLFFSLPIHLKMKINQYLESIIVYKEIYLQKNSS